MVNGHLTICKIYKDGTKEIVLDKSNMITKGLGSSLIDILEGRGAVYHEDFVPYYFQVGTSSVDTLKFISDTSAYFYQLSSPLSWSEYGDDTDLILDERYRGFYASTVDDGLTYGELYGTSGALSAVVFSGTNQYFGEVPPTKISRVYLDSFEAVIVLDEKTANDKNISEIGLFSKNPRGFRGDSPLLIAYKSFTPVPKSSAFSLVMHWRIGFLGLTTNVDEVFGDGGGLVGDVPDDTLRIISGPLGDP